MDQDRDGEELNGETLEETGHELDRDVLIARVPDALSNLGGEVLGVLYQESDLNVQTDVLNKAVRVVDYSGGKHRVGVVVPPM